MGLTYNVFVTVRTPKAAVELLATKMKHIKFEYNVNTFVYRIPKVAKNPLIHGYRRI